MSDSIHTGSPHADCTCPSGDGSLRGPCPVHPPRSEATATPQGMPLPVALRMAAQARCERDMLRAFGDAGDEAACLSAPVRCAIALFEELERRIGSESLQRMAAGTSVPVEGAP